MHSVCRCSLPVWRRSFLKKGTPMTYFCPALDPPLGGSGRKTTTLVRDHEYFIPTKFHQNPSSGSREEVENVKVYGRQTTDGRRTDDGRTDGRTDDGRCAMTIAHSSLRLRWAKKDKNTLQFQIFPNAVVSALASRIRDREFESRDQHFPQNQIFFLFPCLSFLFFSILK